VPAGDEHAAPGRLSRRAPSLAREGVFAAVPRLPAGIGTLRVSRSALSKSELGAGDLLVGTTKQDCGGSSNHSEQGQIGVERLPRYA
jgi:hypothetical protein